MHPEALNKEVHSVFSELGQFQGFYLAGGTALALQIGHRISIDFDFFSENEIPDDLITQVKKVFENRNISTTVNNPDELTVFVDSVKVSFIKYPFPVILGLIDYEGLKLLDVKEISATKAYSIGRRGSYKDYVDLYFIVSQNIFSLNDIINLAHKKYGNEFNGRLFLEQLVYLEDIEDLEILFLKDRVAKEELEKFFVNEIKNLNL